MGKGKKITPDRIRVGERRARALRMRRNGADYATITEALGYGSPAACRKDVSRALKQVVHEAGRELIDLERERLDTLHAVLWPKVKSGDTKAVREFVRVMERRAKLLGLDGLATQHRENAEAESMLQSMADQLQELAGNLPDHFDVSDLD